MRSDAPCAVIMTVRVVTAAGWCSVRIPFSCSDAITVSLCTSSPRMVSGCAWAWFNASAMASRTPKHMPRCSARMIFIRLGIGFRSGSASKSNCFVLQSNRLHRFVCVQRSGLFCRLGLLNDLFEQVDVGGEGSSAARREREGRQWPPALKFLGHRDVAGFLQRAEVRGDVAVGHVQRVAHFSERKLRRGGQNAPY